MSTTAGEPSPTAKVAKPSGEEASGTKTAGTSKNKDKKDEKKDKKAKDPNLLFTAKKKDDKWTIKTEDLKDTADSIAQTVQVGQNAYDLLNKFVDGDYKDMFKDSASIENTLSTFSSVGSLLSSGYEYIVGGEEVADAGAAASGLAALAPEAALTGPLGVAAALTVGLGGAIYSVFSSSSDSTTEYKELKEEIQKSQDHMIDALKDSVEILDKEIKGAVEVLNWSILKNTQEVIQAIKDKKFDDLVNKLHEDVQTQVRMLAIIRTNFVEDFLKGNAPEVTNEGKTTIVVKRRVKDKDLIKNFRTFMEYNSVTNSLTHALITLKTIKDHTENFKDFLADDVWLRKAFIGICEQWQQLAILMDSFWKSVRIEPTLSSGWTNQLKLCGFLQDIEIRQWFLIDDANNVDKVASNFDVYGDRVKFLLRHNQLDLNTCKDKKGQTLVNRLIEDTKERKDKLDKSIKLEDNVVQIVATEWLLLSDKNRLTLSGFRCTPDYELSFHIKIHECVKNDKYSSIIQFTATGKDSDTKYGDRIPAVFLFPNSTGLQVCAGTNTDANGPPVNWTKELDIGKEHKIKIRVQNDKCVVKIDDDVQTSTLGDRKEFEKVHVCIPNNDKSTPPANASVRYVRYTALSN